MSIQLPFGKQYSETSDCFKGTVGQSSVDKLKRFPAWKPSKSKKPEFAWLNKKEIKVDGDYQRKTSNEKLIARVRCEFDWIQFGCLCVAMRDGVWFCVDGAHRLAGVLSRSDIQEVPCLVFESESAQSEAEAFIGINESRKSVGAMDRFRASLVAGDKDCVELRDYLETQSVKVQSGRLESIGTTLQAWKKDKEQFKRICPLLYLIHGSDKFDGELIRAIVHIDNTQQLTDKIKTRLIDIGHIGLKTAIRQSILEAGNSCPAVWAGGILRLAKKRTR